MEEIWKDIPDYEGLYQVSSKGRVKSLSRRIKNNKGYFISKEYILKSAKSSNGYLSVVLRKDLKSKTFRVHVLIAISFLNHKQQNYNKVVDHIDNVKTNNNLENIQVISARENKAKDSKNRNGFLGVKVSKEGYISSSIHIGKNNVHLGMFASKKEAHDFYIKAMYNTDKFVNNKQFRKLLHEL